MITNSLLRLPSLALLVVTLFYRRFLSHRKTCRCAHAVVHGPGTSCSDVALTVFRQHPIVPAVIAMREQFDACRTAKNFLADESGSADIECCELMLNWRELILHLRLGDNLADLYMVLCIIKYLLAGSYLLGSGGETYGFFYGWLAPNLIGAAASQIWPVVLCAAYLDFRVVQSLRGDGPVLNFVLSQYGLGILVMFVEPWIVAAYLGGTSILWVVLTEVGQPFLEAHLQMFLGVKLIPLTLLQACFYALIFVVNGIDNLGKRSR